MSMDLYYQQLCDAFDIIADRNPQSPAACVREKQAEALDEEFDAGKLDHEYGCFVARTIGADAVLEELVNGHGLLAEFRIDGTGDWNLWAGDSRVTATHIGERFRTTKTEAHKGLADKFLQDWEEAS